MTREELQSAIQDFWDEAFHYGKHEISDTSKVIALECMMDEAKRRSTHPPTNADRIRAMSDEEMARLVFMGREGLFCNKYSFECKKECSCEDCVLDWLKQPAEEAR